MANSQTILSRIDIRAGYTSHEIEYLARYGARLRALFDGTVEAKNPIECDFLRMCASERKAQHIGERIFIKWYTDDFFEPKDIYEALPSVLLKSDFEIIEDYKSLVIDEYKFLQKKARIKKAPNLYLVDPKKQWLPDNQRNLTGCYI